MFYKTTILALFVAATLSNVWANAEFNKSNSMIDYKHSYLVASSNDLLSDTGDSDEIPDARPEIKEIEITLTPPPAITQEATGSLTTVTFGTATAVDDDGNTVPLQTMRLPHSLLASQSSHGLPGKKIKKMVLSKKSISQQPPRV